MTKIRNISWWSSKEIIFPIRLVSLVLALAVGGVLAVSNLSWAYRIEGLVVFALAIIIAATEPFDDES